MVSRAAFLGATRSVVSSTADNTVGAKVSCPPSSAVAVEVVAPSGTYTGLSGTLQIQGSLIGDSWVALSTALPFSTSVGFVKGVTTTIPVTNVRAVLLSHAGAANPVDIFISARS